MEKSVVKQGRNSRNKTPVLKTGALSNNVNAASKNNSIAKPVNQLLAQTRQFRETQIANGIWDDEIELQWF